MLKDSEELFQISENACRQTLEADFYLRATDNENTLHYNKASMQLCARYVYKRHLSLRMNEAYAKKEVRLLANILLKNIIINFIYIIFFIIEYI